ncbi:MAG: aldo/keto reductase [Paenibacillus sp.]|nr:aldo/keto reductase [Paenibacillus sp.]
MSISVNIQHNLSIRIFLNIFYQETVDAFKAAQENDIALITFEGVRSRWSPEIIRKRSKLVEKIQFITDQETTMTMAALRFILSYPEVSTVIPGVRNSTQLIENISASADVMPKDQVKKLQELWETDIKFQNLGW